MYRWKLHWTLFRTLSSKAQVKNALSPGLPFLKTWLSDTAIVSFLMKLQIYRIYLYQKRDSETSVFLWISWISSEHFFCRTPLDDCFCVITHSVCCPTRTFQIFKNDITHIFRLSTFLAWFVKCEWEWIQYFNF